MTHPPITDEMVERAAREPSDAELGSKLRNAAMILQIRGFTEEARDVGIAAQRLETRGDISEAMTIRAARAACEATKPGRCLFPSCLCEDAARKVIDAALEAALSGKEE